MSSTIKLNMLRPRHGIDKKSLGRGIGSGCGKTSSYGHKGGKARSGRGAPSWFEGGQMPLYRRLPKRGFKSRADKDLIACVNLETLEILCNLGVYKTNDVIDLDSLKANNVVRSKAKTVKLLGKGTLSVALNMVVNYATESAKKGIADCGGSVKIV